MPKEMDSEIFKLHDERLSEHDKLFSTHERSFQEIEDQLKYMIGRIDNGVSPSVNEVRKDNAELKEKFSTLEHKIELNMRDMKDLVQGVASGVDSKMDNFTENVITPIKKDMNRIQSVLFYGLVGALIVFAGQKLAGNIWDKIFEKAPQKVESIADLKALPLKK